MSFKRISWIIAKKYKNVLIGYSFGKIQNDDGEFIDIK